MSLEEQNTEAAIQAKGLTAPRLTPQDIDDTIVGADFYVFPGTTLTICALKLRNGFIVTGESAAASPENFDAEIGRQIAQRNAREKIWPLEGYLLRERLAGAAEPPRVPRVGAQDTRSRGEPRP
ncbi:Gp49 family protein [Methylobacterium sp. E-045]|uniref:Gp49 family protein n=1 Tax=Methylobacterium sp. E-045 TaxID=2836575 RepID=UPI001FB9DAC2|nr:Gp49 family protein [Methylobacterium sp. E-045]MCJ2129250.1 Gp49 family protein [Methylobacterium sp. E-045]